MAKIVGRNEEFIQFMLVFIAIVSFIFHTSTHKGAKMPSKMLNAPSSYLVRSAAVAVAIENKENCVPVFFSVFVINFFFSIQWLKNNE